MAAIKWIPTVPNCCFCINLEIGTILIVIWGMVTLGPIYPTKYAIMENSTFIFLSNDYEPANKCQTTAFFTIVIVILNLCSAAVHAIALFTSIALLIGICLKKPITVIIYIYVMLASIVVTLLQVTVFQLKALIVGYCGSLLGKNIIAISTILLWTYFIIVVNSYYDKLVGTILIGICGLIMQGAVFPSETQIFVGNSINIQKYYDIDEIEIRTKNCPRTGFFSVVSSVLEFLSATFRIFAFFASIALLVGILLKKKITVIIFIYVILATIVFTVFQLIIYQIKALIVGYCGSLMQSDMLAIIIIMLWAYFIMVVNSYYDEMDEMATDSPPVQLRSVRKPENDET